MSETKVPSIPAVPGGVDSQLAGFLNAMREAVQVREGQRGQLLDAGVTFRDLVSLGLAEETSAGDPNASVIRRSRDALTLMLPFDTGLTDYSTPPAPTGLAVTGVMTAILLEWDWHNYRNHQHTEVWRNTTDTLVGATLVGTTVGRTYADSVGTNSTYYYWVRFKSRANVTGPYNSQSGTLGKTEIDPEFALQSISGKIEKSDLAGSLRSVVGALEEAYVIKVKPVGSTEAVSGFGLAYEEEKSNFLIAADRFAIIAPATTSERNNANNDPLVPFAVTTTSEVINGVTIPAGSTFIKSAYIKDASITNAKIANLAAEKIQAGTINVALTLNAATMYGASIYGGTPYNGFYPLSITGGTARFYTDSFAITDISGTVSSNPFVVTNGKVYITSASIQDGTIGDAKIGNTIQSSNFITGVRGWKIDKTGQMEMNDATFRGTIDVKSAATGARLEIKSNVIKVYDANGVLRVRLGDLTA